VKGVLHLFAGLLQVPLRLLDAPLALLFAVAGHRTRRLPGTTFQLFDLVLGFVNVSHT